MHKGLLSLTTHHSIRHPSSASMQTIMHKYISHHQVQMGCFEKFTTHGNQTHHGGRRDTGLWFVWQSYFISFLHHFFSIRPACRRLKGRRKSHYQRKWQEIKRAGTVKITHDYPGERYRGREGSGGMESQGEMERARERERRQTEMRASY